MWISVVVTCKIICYSTFKVLNTCRLRCQSTRGVKTDIKQQTFRVANFPSNKWPYQVIERRQSIYIIKDVVKGKQIKTHIHNLRPFAFNPTQVNPLDVAQQNEQEFVVDHHRRSTLEFLVRWAGYDESSNSWEPYKALIQGPFSSFLCLSDVEASSSTSIHSCSRFILIHIHVCTFT